MHWDGSRSAGKADTISPAGVFFSPLKFVNQSRWPKRLRFTFHWSLRHIQCLRNLCQTDSFSLPLTSSRNIPLFVKAATLNWLLRDTESLTVAVREFRVISFMLFCINRWVITQTDEWDESFANAQEESCVKSLRPPAGFPNKRGTVLL